MERGQAAAGLGGLAGGLHLGAVPALQVGVVVLRHTLRICRRDGGVGRGRLVGSSLMCVY